MSIAGLRTSYITERDKVRGSVGHVRCITEPALGHPITLPFRDIMQCVLHVDEVADVFARVLLPEKPAHRIYNTGGTTVSLGEIADIVRSFLPDARISFEKETGARQRSATYLPDNSRLSYQAQSARPERNDCGQRLKDRQHVRPLAAIAPSLGPTLRRLGRRLTAAACLA